MNELLDAIGQKYTEYAASLMAVGVALKAARNTPEYREYLALECAAWDTYHSLQALRGGLPYAEDPSTYLNGKEFYEGNA
jgi:hypothetical protein